MKKQALCGAAVLALMLSSAGTLPEMFPAGMSLTARAETASASGNCGDQGGNVTWELSSDGVLTVCGSGRMADGDSLSPFFAYSANIKRVEIGAGVTYIGKYAFMGLSALESVSVADTVTSIGNKAFSSCPKLISFKIPDSVTEMKSYVFADCTGLKSVSFGSGLTSLPSSAFKNCTSLDSLTIPGSIVTIGSGVFSGCSSLRTLTLSDGIRTVGGKAFLDCVSLTAVSIPASVTDIGERAFGYYYDQTAGEYLPVSGFTIFCHEGSSAEEYAAANGFAVKQTAEEGISGVCGQELAYTLDENGTLTITGSGKMYDYSDDVKAPWSAAAGSIKKVSLQEGVTSVGEYAFAGCGSLAGAELPDTLAEIGSRAFYDCPELHSVTVPKNTGAIGEAALGFCGETALPDFTVECWSLSEGLRYAAREGFRRSIIDAGEYTFGEIVNDPGSDKTDINNDDVIAAQQLSAKWRVKDAEPRAADVNCDGLIDNDDVILIQQYSAKWRVKLGL